MTPIVRPWTKSLKLLLVMFMAAWSVAASPAFAQKMNSGWYWPTGSSNSCGFLGWRGHNSPTHPYHLAQDMCNALGNPVYSIGPGMVIYSRTDASGYGPNHARGGALIARHQASDGTWFTALYGHLTRPHATGAISAGEIIGYSNAWSPPHVHFAIHPGFDPEPANPWRGYTNSTSSTYGFTDPIPFLNAHPAQSVEPVQVTDLFEKNSNGQHSITCSTITVYRRGYWYDRVTWRQPCT